MNDTILAIVMGVMTALWGLWAIFWQKISFKGGYHYTGPAAVFIGWGFVALGGSAITGTLIFGEAFLCVWVGIILCWVPFLRVLANGLSQKPKRMYKPKRKRTNTSD